MHHSRTARHGPQAITTDDADSSFGCSIAMSGTTTQRAPHSTAHSVQRSAPDGTRAQQAAPSYRLRNDAAHAAYAHRTLEVARTSVPGAHPTQASIAVHRAAPCCAASRCMLRCGVLQRCVLHIATVRVAGIGLARRAAQQVRRCGTRLRHGRARGVRGCPNPGSARHGEGRVVRVQVRLLA